MTTAARLIRISSRPTRRPPRAMSHTAAAMAWVRRDADRIELGEAGRGGHGVRPIALLPLPRSPTSVGVLTYLEIQAEPGLSGVSRAAAGPRGPAAGDGSRRRPLPRSRTWCCPDHHRAAQDPTGRRRRFARRSAKRSESPSSSTTIQRMPIRSEEFTGPLRLPSDDEPQRICERFIPDPGFVEVRLPRLRHRCRNESVCGAVDRPILAGQIAGCPDDEDAGCCRISRSCGREREGIAVLVSRETGPTANNRQRPRQLRGTPMRPRRRRQRDGAILRSRVFCVIDSNDGPTISARPSVTKSETDALDLASEIEPDRPRDERPADHGDGPPTCHEREPLRGRKERGERRDTGDDRGERSGSTQ